MLAIGAMVCSPLHVDRFLKGPGESTRRRRGRGLPGRGQDPEGRISADAVQLRQAEKLGEPVRVTDNVRVAVGIDDGYRHALPFVGDRGETVGHANLTRRQPLGHRAGGRRRRRRPPDVTAGNRSEALRSRRSSSTSRDGKDRPRASCCMRGERGMDAISLLVRRRRPDRAAGRGEN